jgi:outer membrane receptor for ferrienterochelin and colicins
VHPSTVDNIEFAYDRAVPAIGSTLRTALFGQRTKDIISQPFAVPPVAGSLGLPVLLANNVGGSDAIGLELGLKGHSPSGFRWNASYAFVATTDNTVLNQGAVLTSAVDYARSVPRHVLTAGIGYAWEKLELDLMGRWQSSYRDFQGTGNGVVVEPVDIRNYLTLNARAGYRLTENLTLALVAEQFNTPSILRSAGPPVERLFIASLAAHF